MMDALVLDGGHMPDAADYEDVGSEMYRMIQSYDSSCPMWQSLENDVNQIAEQNPPKQVMYALYGTLGAAVALLAALWIKMF